MTYRPQGLKCPACGTLGMETTDSRPATMLGHPSVRRRRVCRSCGHRLTTFELPADKITSTAEVKQAVDAARQALLGALDALGDDV